MKTKINFLVYLVLFSAIVVLSSCQQDKMDPVRALDEVFIPSGYATSSEMSNDVSSRLQELQLENPSDNFYYLKRQGAASASSGEWIFPQKELKIEFVNFDRSSEGNKEPMVLGVIVKKIKGNWADEEYFYVDSKPTPKDGMNAFFLYVQENLKYPEEAKKSGIEGKVFIEFVINSNGQLTDVKSVRGIGGGCDEEAVRVIREAPTWNPGLIEGKPAKVKMMLPITYKIG